MPRTTREDLAKQAEYALVGALRALGHQGAIAPGSAAWDLTATVDGIEVPIEVRAASVITPGVARRLLVSSPEAGEAARIAVGDLVTAPARQVLNDAGWGWLDRRGHLMLRAAGVHIDADVSPDARTVHGPQRPISGRAAFSWAAALLQSPEDPPSIREVSRRVSISHSAIVVASQRLTAASLVRSDGRPLVPELFWILAEEWKPERVALAQLPPAGDPGTYNVLEVNFEGRGPGWAVSGTVGAVAWGAPTAIGSAYPPDFYVLSAADLRQATLRLGQAARFEDRACTVALAPTPLVCIERYDRMSDQWGHWRFAHGLFAALDLAQDRARGAEILADWAPKDFHRVW